MLISSALSDIDPGIIRSPINGPVDCRLSLAGMMAPGRGACEADRTRASIHDAE